MTPSLLAHGLCDTESLLTNAVTDRQGLIFLVEAESAGRKVSLTLSREEAAKLVVFLRHWLQLPEVS